MDQESITTSNVFELIGEPKHYHALPADTLFMIEETQINNYWKTKKKDWQPYISSIVFKKIWATSVQRYMTPIPTPIEHVADIYMVCYPVKFIG